MGRALNVAGILKQIAIFTLNAVGRICALNTVFRTVCAGSLLIIEKLALLALRHLITTPFIIYHIIRAALSTVGRRRTNCALRRTGLTHPFHIDGSWRAILDTGSIVQIVSVVARSTLL